MTREVSGGENLTPVPETKSKVLSYHDALPLYLDFELSGETQA